MYIISHIPVLERNTKEKAIVILFILLIISFLTVVFYPLLRYMFNIVFHGELESKCEPSSYQWKPHALLYSQPGNGQQLQPGTDPQPVPEAAGEAEVGAGKGSGSGAGTDLTPGSGTGAGVLPKRLLLLGENIPIEDLLGHPGVKPKRAEKKQIKVIDFLFTGFDDSLIEGFDIAQHRVFIKNFAYRKEDAHANELKLRLLEKLLFFQDSHIEIIISSRFEPMGYFNFSSSPSAPGKKEEKEKKENKEKKPTATSPSKQDIANRWQRVLSFFEVRYTGRPLGTNTKGNRDVYDDIWMTSSIEEKQVMLQLAQEGLLNFKNRKVIRRLVGRGIILWPPVRFADKGLRNYIKSVEDLPQLLEKEEREEENRWKRYKRPFFFGVTLVLLFLVVTQPQVLDSWMVIIPALTSGIPAVIRVIDQFIIKSAAVEV